MFILQYDEKIFACKSLCDTLRFLEWYSGISIRKLVVGKSSNSCLRQTLPITLYVNI